MIQKNDGDFFVLPAGEEGVCNCLQNNAPFSQQQGDDET